jgi:cytochrome c biogenesis protein CcdA/thiol-disulfide isomerase/thioredoxin
VLSVGVQGGGARPYGLILGFIATFCAFTLLSRQLVQLLGLDSSVIRQVAFLALLVLGVVMLSNRLGEAFGSGFQNLAGLGQSATRQSQTVAGLQGSGSFLSGFLSGIFVGLIWSPCAGPVIGLVLVDVIRQKSDAQSLFLLGSFSLGVGFPMLLITLGGQRVLSKLEGVRRHSGLIRKTLGGVIISTVLLTGGPDLFRVPHLAGFAVTRAAANPDNLLVPQLRKGLPLPYPAPDFSGINTWINSPSLTMSQLKGKVVLVDFWTYSCINCVRTLPTITRWDRQYRREGLVIVGVHSPEFDFEKNVSNVQAAVKQHHIQYPVALDNTLDTFTGFKNQYWPAHYLINRNGQVVYTHFGEGEYEQTENNIRVLLGSQQKTLTKPQPPEVMNGDHQTPETYLGYERGTGFSSPERLQRRQNANYSYPKALDLDSWALNGIWKSEGQHITSKSATSAAAPTGLRLRFTARKVYLVLGRESDKLVKVSVLMNGKPVSSRQAGAAVKGGQLIVDRHALYSILSLDKAQTGVLELQVHGAGLEAYAFTFGS